MWDWHIRLTSSFGLRNETWSGIREIDWVVTVTTLKITHNLSCQCSWSVKYWILETGEGIEFPWLHDPDLGSSVRMPLPFVGWSPEVEPGWGKEGEGGGGGLLGAHFVCRIVFLSKKKIEKLEYIYYLHLLISRTNILLGQWSTSERSRVRFCSYMV